MEGEMEPRKIVMLDDSRTVLLSSRNALVESGFSVTIATDPGELDPSEMRGAAMILVDINMPEMFGDDVVRILRERYEIVGPIYLYSTIGNQEGEQRAKDSGADGFFRKRDPAALVADVLRVLAPQSRQQDGDWEAGFHARLLDSLSEHQQRVRILTSARANVEQRVLRRSIALEIHGAGGECALMGFGQIRELASELTGRLLDPMILVPEPCWVQIAEWFGGLCQHVAAVARGETPDLSKEELVRERDELTRALHTSAMATFRPPSQIDEAFDSSSGRRLLVIDDSAVVRTLLSSSLGDLGYPVETARNLDEAARKLFEFEPELVIADVQLPDVEGDEICVRFKSNRGRVLPVIFYSGLEKNELAQRARAAGADGYVGKDEGIDALVRCIESLFREVVLY